MPQEEEVEPEVGDIVRLTRSNSLVLPEGSSARDLCLVVDVEDYLSPVKGDYSWSYESSSVLILCSDGSVRKIPSSSVTVVIRDDVEE